MRHLECSRCAKRLIEDFWIMVAAEATPTFSRVTLTCTCGMRNSVALDHGADDAGSAGPIATIPAAVARPA